MQHIISDIIETHHKYLRNELPALLDLACDLIKSEGDTFPIYYDIKRAFVSFFVELITHLDREENVFFPHISRASENLIKVLEKEHESIEHKMALLKQISSNYHVPEGASKGYQELMQRLEFLEKDLTIHTSKEDKLFSSCVNRA